MKSQRNSLVSPRKQAFKAQSGKCFYCNQPMWLENPDQFATRYRLSTKQARLLECTGEHLIPHHEGGPASASNIVAACWYCNSRRHRPSKPLQPTQYRSRVQRRISKGRWHQVLIVEPSSDDMRKSIVH